MPAPLDMSAIDGYPYEVAGVGRASRFCDDEVEEDIDEEELLRAFGNSSPGSTPAQILSAQIPSAFGATPKRETPGAWDDNWMKLSEGVVGHACGVESASATPQGMARTRSDRPAIFDEPQSDREPDDVDKCGKWDPNPRVA